MNSTTEIVLPGKVETSGLQIRTRDLAAPAQGEVVLRMEATGVSFAEQQMRRGKYYNQPSWARSPSTTAIRTCTTGSPTSRPTAWTRCSTTSAARDWSNRGGYCTKAELWAGHRRLATFRRNLAVDLTQVFGLLADGMLVPQIAERCRESFQISPPRSRAP
jgi:hypothetical protein